ncbi:MAG: hypothetical protein IBX61_08145 [Thermoleophilia bacterium]|nr:hypothetical protein [Thermoleophilia bacterium]
MSKAPRIIPASAGLIVAVIILVALLAGTSAPVGAVNPTDTLISIPVSEAPVLDGDAGDAAWANAPELSIPVSGGWYGSGSVTAKSVYRDGMVYFLYQWEDEDESVRRQPWQKQGDGSWLRVPGTQWPSPKCPVGDASCEQYWTMKDPDAAGEDKISVLWNINTPGFETAGCAITCHWGADRENGAYGRKYTPNPGELVDTWHWKGNRTAPVGQTDDQYIDSTTGSGDWGRKSDPRITGTGYSNNYISGGTEPLKTSPTQPAPPWWIMADEATDFVDTYQPGDEIASILVSPFEGDRGSLPTGSNYDESTGTWTVEIARQMITVGNDGVTPSPYDVQFDDLGAAYPFGVAIFDNTSVAHSMSSLYQMTFARPDMSLSKTDVYWASYDDYTERILSVDYSIANVGPQANGVSIVGTVNTEPVTTVTGMPVSLGDIAAGGSAAATLKYDVPNGVTSFKTTVYAETGDGHSYPGPMPGA